MCRRLFLALALALPLAATAQATLERAFPDLPPPEFGWATTFRSAGNGDSLLYLVEQDGLIQSFAPTPDVSSKQPFLDIRDRVFYDAEPDPGMIGLTFHPDYEANGLFFVTYFFKDEKANTVNWRLSRFTRDDDPSVPVRGQGPQADPDSEVILIELALPFWSHAGGDLHFGADGYLYVSLGDGRCCGDPDGHAQDLTALQGSILRLDVDDPAPGLDYGIPPDNPFVGNTEGWREEIWAYGFRNPWRFSIDAPTGQVWAGDVGELTWEEVNLVEAGQNYGWNEMEGPECFDGNPCTPSDYTLPVWSYDRDEGFSVIGGYVYRGELVPELCGQYIFADWGSRQLWALDYDPDSGEPPAVTLLSENAGVSASSFGLDDDGELYALHTFTGAFFKLVPAPPLSNEPPPLVPEEITLRLWPNPAATTLEVRAPLDFESVAIYDILGRHLVEAPLQPDCFCARLDLDLATFPPGVYVARAGELVETFTVVR